MNLINPHRSQLASTLAVAALLSAGLAACGTAEMAYQDELADYQADDTTMLDDASHDSISSELRRVRALRPVPSCEERGFSSYQNNIDVSDEWNVYVEEASDGRYVPSIDRMIREFEEGYCALETRAQAWTAAPSCKLIELPIDDGRLFTITASRTDNPAVIRVKGCVDAE